MNKQKRTFAIILALLSITLAILPFLVTFNEILTKIVERLSLYRFLQEMIVPLEARMVGVIVSLFGINFSYISSAIIVNGTIAQITWNCLGWQSFLFLLVTFLVGLKGKYTLWSKIEAIILGTLGTLLINIFRLSLITLLLAYNRSLFSVIYHDYLAAIVTILWLFVFWWFAYTFVLEEKKPETWDDLKVWVSASPQMRKNIARQIHDSEPDRGK